MIKPEKEDFSEINNGIIFVLASWSSSSIRQFAFLTKTLNTVKSNKINFYVFNSDKLNYENLQRVGVGVLHGNGETFWIKNYKIKRFLAEYSENDTAKIISYTNELLEDH